MKKYLILGSVSFFLAACGGAEEQVKETEVKKEVVEEPIIEEVEFVPAVFPADTVHFTCAEKVKPGAALTINFTNPVGATDVDQYWVAITKAGSEESEWGTWKMVEAGTTTIDLAAPAEAGDYEVRLHNSYPSLSFHMIQSTPVTVK